MYCLSTSCKSASIFALNQPKGGLRPKESILRACFLSVYKTKVGAQLSLLPKPVLSSPLFSVFVVSSPFSVSVVLM